MLSFMWLKWWRPYERVGLRSKRHDPLVTATRELRECPSRMIPYEFSLDCMTKDISHVSLVTTSLGCIIVVPLQKTSWCMTNATRSPPLLSLSTDGAPTSAQRKSRHWVFENWWRHCHWDRIERRSRTGSTSTVGTSGYLYRLNEEFQPRGGYTIIVPT